MLVIARRKGQRVRIGPDVEVVVTGLSRGVVRLGISAPTDVHVIRSEIVESVVEANREAAESAIDVPSSGSVKPASVKSLRSPSPGR